MIRTLGSTASPISSAAAHSVAFAALAALWAACPAPPSIPVSPPADEPIATHGVGAGEVTDRSAVIWSRTVRDSYMHVRLTPDVGDAAEPDAAVAPDSLIRRAHRHVTADRDFAAAIPIGDLRPDTAYRYDVWFSDRADESAPKPGIASAGTLRTAPAADVAAPVTFTWSGDLAGQNACRDSAAGFPIFARLAREEQAFFIALGDMIYADGVCETTGAFGNLQIPRTTGRATAIEAFWAHWRYNREDAGYREFLAATPIYAIWDDHETVNDAGPAHDTRDQAPYRADLHLLPLALRAFLDYNPIAPSADDPRRLYRSARWGEHLELFILDTRQHRDANSAPDDPASPKTMLGAAQRAWLIDAVGRSTATWKIVVSSVPLSIPTGDPLPMGRDGWANFDQQTGFEHELLAILRAFADAGVQRSVWITTDVHFAAGYRHTPLSDRPDFHVYELAVGPLNAGLFPNRDVDDTLSPERLFFYGPDSVEQAEALSWRDAMAWMSYGVIAIDAAGALTVRVVAGDGRRVFETTLPAPAAL